MRTMKMREIPVFELPGSPSISFACVWVEGRLLRTPWLARWLPRRVWEPMERGRIRQIVCRAMLRVFSEQTIRNVVDGSARDDKAVAEAEASSLLYIWDGRGLPLYCRERVDTALPQLLFALTEGGMHVDAVSCEVTAYRLRGNDTGGYAARLTMEESGHGA